MGQIVTVNFRNDTLFAVERDDGVFVALKPICDALGLLWSKQRERINRDPILSEGSTVVGLPSPGGMQETTVLKLEMMNGWLFTIDESRVKDEETRQKVLAYKRECYSVLFTVSFGGVLGGGTEKSNNIAFIVIAGCLVGLLIIFVTSKGESSAVTGLVGIVGTALGYVFGDKKKSD